MVREDHRDAEQTGARAMTLRLRLVVGLLVLLTVGLASFGYATYDLYRHSEYQRLDDQIRNSEPFVDGQLDQQAGFTDQGGPGGPGFGPGGGRPGPAPYGPIGTYAQLRSATGAVLATISSTSATPKLPASYPLPVPGGRWFTVGSTSGSGQFRSTFIVAFPSGDCAQK